MKQLFYLKALCCIFLMPAGVFSQQTLPPPPPPPPPPPHMREENRTPVNTVFSIVEQMPEYVGGMKAMFEYLSSNIKYPAVARENEIEGTVYLGFVVQEDGSLTNIVVKRGVSGGCSEEAVRVVQNMPKWNPGKQQGKVVKVNYTLPIKFRLNEPEPPKPIYNTIDTMPKYATGEADLFKFLSKNIKYPAQARKNKVEGTVYTTFVVLEDGSISNAVIKKSVGGGCDEEALRVISMMPKWNPGIKNGQKVAAYFTLPIKFKLN